MPTTLEPVVRDARRFGWTALVVWALVGVGIEVAHAWKLSAVLDDEIVRLLLRLAHAHGVGLSLVALVHAGHGVPLLGVAAPTVCRALWAGAVLVPAGFLLGTLGHSEADPGLLVLLTPVGALLLLYALGRTALAAWTSPAA